MVRVLIVGKLDGKSNEAAKYAIEKGALVEVVDTIDRAMINLRSGRGADLALVDVRLEMESFISQLESERIKLPVVACGISGTSGRIAEKAIDAGALDFLSLPPDPRVIGLMLEAMATPMQNFITKDAKMQEILNMAAKVANSEASILITGESGTGKEVISRYIHDNSSRAKGPFIAINCAAIPENLLESELFGHEKGAFSGAVARRMGKFEEANNGTILLDEISEMDLRLQAKLLRVIQEREVDPIGASGKPIKINVRILATSNRNMQDFIHENKFREDLYFRLNVINLDLPPLRQRPADTEALAIYFKDKYLKINKLASKEFTHEAIAKLQSHNWPGNVRELENTIHRAVLLANDELITAGEIIFANYRAKQQNPKSLAEVENEHILNTIRYCLGDNNHAAAMLGISVQLLRERLDDIKNKN